MCFVCCSAARAACLSPAQKLSAEAAVRSLKPCEDSQRTAASFSFSLEEPAAEFDPEEGLEDDEAVGARRRRPWISQHWSGDSHGCVKSHNSRCAASHDSAPSRVFIAFAARLASSRVAPRDIKSRTMVSSGLWKRRETSERSGVSVLGAMVEGYWLGERVAGQLGYGLWVMGYGTGTQWRRQWLDQGNSPGMRRSDKSERSELMAL